MCQTRVATWQAGGVAQRPNSLQHGSRPRTALGQAIAALAHRCQIDRFRISSQLQTSFSRWSFQRTTCQATRELSNRSATQKLAEHEVSSAIDSIAAHRNEREDFVSGSQRKIQTKEARKQFTRQGKREREWVRKERQLCRKTEKETVWSKEWVWKRATSLLVEILIIKCCEIP